jgi:carbamoyl-phosphate synthase large subunit
MTSTRKKKIMIAGVGGASLGTEIAKCLSLAGKYDIFGCDISSTAYGLYSTDFTATFHIDRRRYLDDVIKACHAAKCAWLIPGAEQPMVLLGNATGALGDAGIHLVANAPEVIDVCSDKRATFERLDRLGIQIPHTMVADSDASIGAVGFPCIVKPATGTGGSASVFLASSLAEAKVYAHFIRSSGSTPLVQEYIDMAEGEYTVGVLSVSDGRVASSVALRRTLDAKLSTAYRGPAGVISSGYSQGYIGLFPEIRQTAEDIARAIGSKGPINVQGRVRNGRLVPFEINARFSASTYLRALAGINEVDMYLEFLATGHLEPPPSIKPGWYLRSLTEIHVADNALK